jgi:hypothetical protein
MTYIRIIVNLSTMKANCLFPNPADSEIVLAYYQHIKSRIVLTASGSNSIPLLIYRSIALKAVQTQDTSRADGIGQFPWGTPTSVR